MEDDEGVTSGEKKRESARSRHAGVLEAASSMLFLTSVGKDEDELVDVVGDRQLLGGLGPGIQARLVSGACVG